MNTIPRILPALVAAAIIVCPLAAEERGQQRYIVILKKRTGPPPDVARLGGTIESRQDDQVVVTIPSGALAALKGDPAVHYLERVGGTADDDSLLTGVPSDPQPGPSVHAARLTPHPLGTLSWDSGTYKYDGAGNIVSIGTDNYLYDGVQRLTQSSTQGSGETYTYDGFGNMKTKLNMTIPAIQPSTNRYDGYSYNEAGAVLSDGSYTFTYDALGQPLSKIYNNNNATQEYYIYTPNDERIGVESHGWWWWSIRDENGKVLRQYKSSATNPSAPALWVEDFIWRDGLLLGSQRPVEMGGRRHFHLDHLGTPRLITSDNGQLVSYHDYYPFGDEKSSYWQEVAGGFDREEPMKFTGHERDYALGMGAEDGHAVDYMHARYYSPTGGRFLSPDPLGGHMEDPQTLNRYAYAGNNPITLTDPTGLDFYLQCKGNSDTCHDGHVGTSATDANGNVTFSATVVTSASLQNAKSGNRGTVNENGVQITTGGHTYQGIFINNTQSADLSGSGRLQGFNFHIGSSDEKHGVLSAGDFTFNANRDQTRSTLDRRGAFRSIADSRFVTGLSPDEVMFHLFTTQHRFGTGPSPHFSVPDIPTNAVPTRGPFHVDKDVVGLKHLGCATMGVGCN